jgi:hypothetical protein
MHHNSLWHKELRVMINMACFLLLILIETIELKEVRYEPYSKKTKNKPGKVGI